MSTIIKTIDKPRLSVKAQTLATVAAIAGAVLIPQVFHLIGAASGLGTALGEAFLPMHLPIILAGLLAGPYVGAIAGLLGPMVSFLISSMPGAAMLPIMMVELCAYGLAAGLLRNANMPTIAKVLITQVAGRIVRAAAILIAVFAFEREGVSVAAIWTAITTGLFGICMQWLLLPLIVYRVAQLNK